MKSDCAGTVFHPDSGVVAQAYLEEGQEISIFGQGVFSSNYRMDSYRLSNGDSCYGPVAHVSLSGGFTDGKGHYVDAGAGSILNIAGSNWLVTGVQIEAEGGSIPHVNLALLPDTAIPAPFDTIGLYSQLAVLPGGRQNSGVTLDGTFVIISPHDPGDIDSAGTELQRIFIQTDDVNRPKVEMKAGDRMQTHNYTWQVLKLYVVNVNGLNYTRILLGRR